jgi:hypothetical protein
MIQTNLTDDTLEQISKEEAKELIMDDILTPEDAYFFVRRYKLPLLFPVYHMVSLQDALAYGRLAGLDTIGVVTEHRVGRLA